MGKPRRQLVASRVSSMADVRAVLEALDVSVEVGTPAEIELGYEGLLGDEYEADEDRVSRTLRKLNAENAELREFLESLRKENGFLKARVEELDDGSVYFDSQTKRYLVYNRSTDDFSDGRNIHKYDSEERQDLSFTDNPMLVEILNATIQKSEDIEALAETVHNAWHEEKKRAGIDHPDMGPYSELDETTKEYDRVTVKAVLKAIGLDADI